MSPVSSEVITCVLLLQPNYSVFGGCIVPCVVDSDQNSSVRAEVSRFNCLYVPFLAMRDDIKLLSSQLGSPDVPVRSVMDYCTLSVIGIENSKKDKFGIN